MHCDPTDSFDGEVPCCPDYEPRTSDLEGTDSQMESDKEWSGDEEGYLVAIHEEVNYIICSSSLNRLLSWCRCPECGSVDFEYKMHTVGTMMNITFLCTSCQIQSKWDSQPYIGHFPAVNILSAGIFFAGTSANKAPRALNSIGVATYHRRTFFSPTPEAHSQSMHRSCVHQSAGENADGSEAGE